MNEKEEQLPTAMGRVNFHTRLGPNSVADGELAYVIRRTDSAGLMATIGTVLTQLSIAEWLRAQPVIDLSQNNAYLESAPIAGKKDVWDYYFLPVGPSLGEATAEGFRLLYSEEHHPVLKIENIEQFYQVLWRKYAIFNHETSSFIEEALADIGIDRTTIAVHARGGDMRIFPGHPLPPTIGQLTKSIWHLLETGEYNKIYVAAQEEVSLEELRRTFGSRVVSSQSFRLSDRVSRLGTPFSGRTKKDVETYANRIRPKHRYELGREVLLDVVALSRAGALVSGTSNVAMWSRIIRQFDLNDRVLINNGWNTSNQFLARFTWSYRSVLPSRLSGFADWSEDWLTKN